jgi:tetratricopeptide (TPR) repeat protein
MNSPMTTACVILALLMLLGTAMFSQQPPQTPGQQALPLADEQEIARLVTESQMALGQHDEQKALSVVKEGLVRFPNNESLQIQLARIYAEQKHDRQAIGLLNAVLLANASSRNAKLELAQIFGYRESYRESDRLYRELLAANADDEAAALGLVHNLLLEGKKAEARAQLQQAFAHHPTSLQLQQYSDYLAANPSENQQRNVHHVQNTEAFFSDTSGNRSVYSSQGMLYQFNRNLTSRMRLEETSLWRTGTVTETVISGAAETRVRLNRYAAVRSSLGAVRFADAGSRLLYGGDLELFPFKGLSFSGGFSRFPISPTYESTLFDLMAEGWHTRLDYHFHNLSINGSFYYTHYNDGNHGEREWGEALQWFPWHDNQFAVGGGYTFRHLHFIKDPNHGYFSPNQYRSHLGAAGFRMRLGRHYRGEYLGYGGAEILEDFAGYSPAGEVLVRNDFLFGRWDLAADYSYFHLIQTTGAFRANAASVTLGYKF